MPLGSFKINGLAKKRGLPKVTATGGTVSDITVGGVTYRTHRFTNTGNTTFTVTGAGTVDILLVGGGGSGPQSGGSGGAGGGAGGTVRRHYAIPVTAQNYTITVGNGGSGSGAGGSSLGLGYTAAGGLTTYQNSPSAEFVQAPQYGRRNADFNNGTFSANWSSTSGGAGAGGNAPQVTSNTNGAGGPGLGDADFTSSLTYYGGGGGGGFRVSTGAAAGLGGIGGGGKGATNDDNTGANGVANTGGGAGGVGRDNRLGLEGGSGIVIIRYAL